MSKIEALITADEIKARCKTLAEEISEDLKGEAIHLIAILKGSYLFLADLSRELGDNVTVDFMSLSSYGDSTKSSGVVSSKLDLSEEIESKNVVVIEDIIDTGLTIEYLRKRLLLNNPKSLKFCTLLDKPANRKTEFTPDYVGFTLDGDAFVVGYGLDYAQKYRNLPYVGNLIEQ